MIMHNDNPVILVAFEEQDNLGIGYIASVLLQNEIRVKIIDFRIGKKNILHQIMVYNPIIIGFSIIFQYYIYEFKDLINYLRENGIVCHLTAGGHYPSMRYIDLFTVIPELDSIVLFEGEYTFLELVQSLYSNKSWRDIKGIAYKDAGSVTTNSLRPIEKDLDNFPIPVRKPLPEYALKKKYATILAGRGCHYNCSFCSIREFYSKSQGPLKRMRHPEIVVREMELLYHQLDCSIFMFQDDDFPISTNREKMWSVNFCNLLINQELNNKILWKINCRPDEVDYRIFESMKNCGLFLVYLGIEDGTDEGLRLLNKHMKSKTILNTVMILKKLGIKYDFGFMLFHPSSTYQTIIDNLDFLKCICEDGSSPITFCKMLPYAGTRIEAKLKEEGRLKGGVGFENYDFMDISLNYLYSFISDCFSEWIGEHDGVLNIARWTRYSLSVYRKFFPITPDLINLEETTNELISQSNNFFIDTIKILIDIFKSPKYKKDDENGYLKSIKQAIDDKHAQYKAQFALLSSTIENMALLYANRETIPYNNYSEIYL